MRNNTGKSTIVNQPLPLPHGVNNNAVGNASVSRSVKCMKVPAPSYDMQIEEEAVMNASVIEKKEEVVVEEEVPFLIVEEPATFQGGDITKFSEWVQKNIKYPAEYAETTISGKVIAQFSIDAKGKIVDIKILRGLDPLLDNEVIRVLQSSPLWKPAKQSGRAVKQQFTIPVVFKLG